MTTNSKKTIVRVTTIPGSLKTLLKGQLKFMSNHYRIIGVSSSGDDLLEVEKNEGIETKAIEMTRVISPIKDIKATIKLYKFLKRERPFIVHTHTPKAGIVGMLAAKLARVPHRYHTVAGMPLLEASGIKRKILNAVESLTYGLATKVFPNSMGLYDIIIDEGYTKKSKLEVIGKGSSNGINVDHFNKDQISEEQQQLLKDELGLKEDDYVLVYVGRLVKDKGVNELIQAFVEFQNINPKANKPLADIPQRRLFAPEVYQTLGLLKFNSIQNTQALLKCSAFKLNFSSLRTKITLGTECQH